MATIKNIINELDNLFKIFNYKFFDSELMKPVITIQTNGKDRNVLGWCTTRKMWQNTETNQDFYEITICAEYLYRDIIEIASTLLHEMAHLYNLQHDIKDVSRNATYHNKKFKETAEKCGLTVEYDTKYGWTITKPTEETIEFINSLKLDRQEFTLTRKTVGAGPAPIEKPKQSFRKYICPVCNVTVRATKDVNIRCGDCDVTMEKEGEQE